MTESPIKGLEQDLINNNPSQRSSSTLDTSATGKDSSIDSPVYTFDETIQLVINEKGSFGVSMLF